MGVIETFPECQMLLGNFRNIKSKQHKQRVRKMATEKFSAAIFCIFMWDYFPLQGNTTIFANITQKILSFRSHFIYLNNRYFF